MLFRSLTDFLLKLWVLYKFTDNFLNCRIDSVLIPLSFISTAMSVHKLPVFIYEEEQKDGRILKGLRFKFPIYMNGRNVLGVDWDNESTDETVVLLSKGIIDSQKVKVEMSLEDMDMSGFQ